MKIIGIMKDNTQVFEFTSEHVPTIGDVVVPKDVKYKVEERFWLLDKKSVVLVVEWA